MPLGNAWECKEEFSPDGKRRIRRERSIGGIVVWGVVAIVLGLLGGSYIPPSFWKFLKP